MRTIETGRTRSWIRETPGRVELRIPARRDWPYLLFLCVWLVGWAIGEASVTLEVLWPSNREGNRLLLALWLLGWTAGGMYAGHYVLWSLVGFDEVVVERGRLALKRTLLGAGRRRVFSLADISRLRARPLPDRPRNPFIGERPRRDWGRLAFFADATMVTFGEGIDTAEGARLVELLGRHGVPLKRPRGDRAVA